MFLCGNAELKYAKMQQCHVQISNKDVMLTLANVAVSWIALCHQRTIGTLYFWDFLYNGCCNFKILIHRESKQFWGVPLYRKS